MKYSIYMVIWMDMSSTRALRCDIYTVALINMLVYTRDMLRLYS